MENIATVTVSVAIIVISFYVIKYLVNKFYQYNMVRNITGPKTFPLIGTLSLFLGNMKDIKNKLMNITNNYPSIWRFSVGLKLFIVLNDPDYIEILSKNSSGSEKPSPYGLIKAFLGNGLFTAPASMWEVHRKMLNPIFKEQTLSTHMGPIIKNSKRLARILETCNGKEIDVLHYVNLCTLNIISEDLLETDLDLQNNPEYKFDEYISELMDICMQRVFKFWLHPNITFRFSSMGKRTEELLSHIHKIIDKVINNKMKSLEGKITNVSGEIDAINNIFYFLLNKGENTSRFLDVLLKSFYVGGEYSKQDIYDEMKTMTIAGSDTTAGTLTFIFLMLASYPEIQNKTYEELYQIYESSDPEDVPITYQDIKNMKYMDRVVKETLRLFPAAPVIARTHSEDIKMDESIVIPRNTEIVIPIFTIHRNRKYWKEPLQFNPDRFLPGNHKAKYFFPFGIGKRRCIGDRLGMIQMKGIIATILRKFIVQIDNPVTVEDVELTFHITLKPVNPVFLRFTRR
ncbi:hypothetical protein M0802_014783 [Mischocyttarus mexicanus]|nr:hypothetical protein M0802_014783 [Mischocyttarus mexicanus]